jgi:hypothetical protein
MAIKALGEFDIVTAYTLDQNTLYRRHASYNISYFDF